MLFGTASGTKTTTADSLGCHGLRYNRPNTETQYFSGRHSRPRGGFVIPVRQLSPLQGEQDHMDGDASFGSWVRRRRKALDLTQQELAARVGCALDTIRKIESGGRRPSRQVAERLADQLDIPVEARAAFLQAARAQLVADRLALPPVPALALSPDTPGSPEQEERPARLPSGTITFLFTVIEGSMQLWERHPNVICNALARHETILRHTVAAHGGVVFKSGGDSLYAAFARAPDALVAAVAAQQALLAEPWGETGPLQVRIVLHTGVAEERDGDYFGLPLNRAARLLASATVARSCSRALPRNWCVIHYPQTWCCAILVPTGSRT